jgi:adenosylhomocysteine nucleosidase
LDPWILALLLRPQGQETRDVSDLDFHDPCLLFALRRESAPFLREFRPQERFPGAPIWARFCGPAWLTVLVVETGIGADRTTQALDWVLSKPLLGNLPYRPQLVLSAGFSGALQDRYQIGDIVLATDVIDEAGTIWPATWPGELPAGEWRPPIHRGRLLGCSRLISDPKDKRDLGEKYRADAVDMETATLARLCSAQGVPFGCVRSVSDRADTALSPRLASVFSGGRLSLWRVAAAVARSPALTRELWDLAKKTRLAARQLGVALGELLTLTLPGGREL